MSAVVVLVGADGDAPNADLTNTKSTKLASAGPAPMQEASGEPHLLDRTKPIDQIVAVVAGIVLSGAAGFALIRS